MATAARTGAQGARGNAGGAASLARTSPAPPVESSFAKLVSRITWARATSSWRSMAPGPEPVSAELQAPGQDQEPALGLRGAGEGSQSAAKDGNPAQDDQTNFQSSLLGIKTAHTEAWPAAQSPGSPADQTSHAKDPGTGATRTDAERRSQGGHPLPREDAGSVQCQHRAGAQTSGPQTQGGAAEDTAHGGHHQPAPTIQVQKADVF